MKNKKNVLNRSTIKEVLDFTKIKTGRNPDNLRRKYRN